MNKPVKFFLSCSIFSFLSLSSFYSQQISEQPVELTSKFVQHLGWESQGVVKHYEVIIEKLNDTNWIQELSKITQKNYCDVSLPAGNYRYKVIFYNVLGQKAFQTEFKTFEIQEAIQPKIKKSLVENLFLKDADYQGGITISCKNISDTTRFFLVQEKTGYYQELPPSITKNSVFLPLPQKNPEAGNYRIIAVNEGGLSSSTGNIRIRDTRKFFLNASAGIAPAFVVYDDFIPENFDTRVLPLTFYAQAAVFADLKNNRRLGPGITLRESPMTRKNNDKTLWGNNFSFNINAVYSQQLCKILQRPLYAEAYAGAGLNILGLRYVYDDGDSSPARTSILPALDAGINAKYLFSRKTFAQCGLEWTNTLDFSMADYNIGTINIIAGIGVEL